MALQAEIDLIVGGMCRLRPGIPLVSEHITVRSVFGRFLEHTGVYYFENSGKQQTLLDRFTGAG